MKKELVEWELTSLKKNIEQEPDGERKEWRLTALKHCQGWIGSRQWHNMLTPMREHTQRIASEMIPYNTKKEAKQELTEEEQAKVQVLVGTYDVYERFRIWCQPEAGDAAQNHRLRNHSPRGRRSVRW